MRHLRRNVITLAATAAAAGGLFLVSVPGASSAAPTRAPARAAAARGAGRFAVAPYVDLTNSQEPLLNQAAKGGLKAFTAAFVIGSGCTPIWGDTLPVTNDPAVTREIATAEAHGAQPIVSFGGEAGVELAQSCPTLSKLTAAYQSVIKALKVTHIDFDIEGAGIADTATNTLRFRAINKLEKADKGLSVSLTIPSLPTGPDTGGKAFLRLAAMEKTHVSVVNMMTMDYGASFDGTHGSMGAAAVTAAKGTLAFLKTVFKGATYAMVGDTPMIGQNDDSAEVFSKADARTLVSFARSARLGRLAFWSADRDQQCGGAVSSLSECSMVSQKPLAFSRIFERFTG